MQKFKVLVTRKWPDSVEHRLSEKFDATLNLTDVPLDEDPPQDGENNIRIVPTADGDPFKERYFHYGVGEQSFLCPKRNFGDDCPVCNFGNQLWNEEFWKRQNRKELTDKG